MASGVAYITDDLDMVHVGIPPEVAPATLMVGKGGGLVAGYLLTPAFYWRLYAIVENLERRWERGEVKEPIVREAWGKWAAIDAWARRTYTDAWLQDARPPQGHRFTALPKPPDRRACWSPWQDVKTPAS